MSAANEMSLAGMGSWVCPARVGDSLVIAPKRPPDAGRTLDNELLEMDVRQMKYLAWLVEREDELELTATAVHMIHFRYKPHPLFELSEAEIDNLNSDIVKCLHASGLRARSAVDSENRLVLSAVGTCRGTKTTDLETLIREVLYWGRCHLGRKGGVSLG